MDHKTRITPPAKEEAVKALKDEFSQYTVHLHRLPWNDC